MSDADPARSPETYRALAVMFREQGWTADEMRACEGIFTTMSPVADELAALEAEAPQPDPVILSAFRTAGVTTADVMAVHARHPEMGFDAYAPLLPAGDAR
jgi:hypothetical protein